MRERQPAHICPLAAFWSSPLSHPSRPPPAAVLGQPLRAAGVEAWARQAKDGDLLGRAVRFRKWSTRRLGERMEDERAAGRLAKGGDAIRVARGKQTPELKPTLKSQGVDKDLAKAARSAAKMDEVKFRVAVDKAIRIAVASVEGTTAIITAARVERHQQKRQAPASQRRSARDHARPGLS